MSDEYEDTLSVSTKWTSDEISNEHPLVSMSVRKDGTAEYSVGDTQVAREVYLDALATVRTSAFAEVRDMFASVSASRVGEMLDILADKVIDDC